jgi:hypothetical protein
VSFRVAGYTNQNIFDDGVLLDYHLVFLILAALNTMIQKLDLLPFSASNFAIQMGLITRSELLINNSFIYWEIWLGFYPAVLLKTNGTSRRNVTFLERPALTKQLTRSSMCAVNMLNLYFVTVINI